MDGSLLVLPQILPIGKWTDEVTAQFLATSTTHTFTWTTDIASEDSAILLDDIKTASVVPIHGNFANRGFRTPLLSDGKYVASPQLKQVKWSGIGWGVARGVTPYGDHGYQYSQYCWLESNVNNEQAVLEQTIDDLVVGQQYRATFYWCEGNGGPNPLTVTADSVKILENMSPSSRKWTQVKTAPFVAKSSSVAIRFSGTRVGVDGSSLVVLLDEVSVVPE